MQESEVRALARLIADQQEARVNTQIARAIREYFKNGLPSGTYSSFQWDGTRIVGAGAAIAGTHAAVSRAATQSLTTGVDTAIAFDTQAFDDESYWSTGTDITAPSTGVYLVDYSVSFDANGTGQREAYLTTSFVCGTQIGGWQRVDAAGAGETRLSGAHLFRVASGCVITLHALQDSGGALAVTSARLAIAKLWVI